MAPKPASEIDAKALTEQLGRQAVAVFDVRSPEEYQAAHIPGAALNPVQALDTRAIPKDRPVVVYCGSSGRSGQAAEKLWEAGFDQVAVLQGGLAAWKEAGYATEGDGNNANQQGQQYE